MEPIYRRNEKDLVLTVTDGAGGVVDLTGFTAATFTLARKRGAAALVTKTLGSGVAITDATNGEVTITLSGVDTDRIGDFYWECKVTDAVANDTTVNSGYLTLLDTTQ